MSPRYSAEGSAIDGKPDTPGEADQLTLIKQGWVRLSDRLRE